MQTNLKASVLNYSQLTMVPLINNVQLEGNVMVDQADGGCLIEMDTSDFNMRIGQGSIHVLTGALQSWINVRLHQYRHTYCCLWKDLISEYCIASCYDAPISSPAPPLNSSSD